VTFFLLGPTVYKMRSGKCISVDLLFNCALCIACEDTEASSTRKESIAILVVLLFACS
jgi:hypothetical protein